MKDHFAAETAVRIGKQLGLNAKQTREIEPFIQAAIEKAKEQWIANLSGEPAGAREPIVPPAAHASEVRTAPDIITGEPIEFVQEAAPPSEPPIKDWQRARTPLHGITGTLLELAGNEASEKIIPKWQTNDEIANQIENEMGLKPAHASEPFSPSQDMNKTIQSAHASEEVTQAAKRYFTTPQPAHASEQLNARDWLVQGGGGYEGGEEGLRAATWMSAGLIDMLNAYREDLLSRATHASEPKRGWGSWEAAVENAAHASEQKPRCETAPDPPAAPASEQESPEAAYHRGYDAGWEAHKERVLECESRAAQVSEVKKAMDEVPFGDEQEAELYHERMAGATRASATWTVEQLDELLDLKFERADFKISMPDYMRRLELLANEINATLQPARASEQEKLNPHTGTCDSTGHGQPL